MDDWELVVIDKKTPKDYQLRKGYMLLLKSKRATINLSDAIGWNCIQRRNLVFMGS